MPKPLTLALLVAGAVLADGAQPLQAATTSTIAVSAINSTAAALPNTDEKERARQRAEYIRKTYTKYEYRIPARDGKLLFTAVYVPNDASAKKTYPILMVRT